MCLSLDLAIDHREVPIRVEAGGFAFGDHIAWARSQMSLQRS